MRNPSDPPRPADTRIFDSAPIRNARGERLVASRDLLTRWPTLIALAQSPGPALHDPTPNDIG